MFYMDSSYIILVLPAILIALYAQMKVSSTFAKYSRLPNRRGYAAVDVVKTMLSQNGIYDVEVEAVKGNLTDHYDPKAKVIRLSQQVYGSTSIAALGVAAHEAGHAVQHAQGYSPLKFRNAIIPICSTGSSLSIPLIFLGFILDAMSLVFAGIILFSLVVLFQLITLPVEYNASRRAIATLGESNILDPEENVYAKKVLSAAALTYVAALIVSAMQLLRFVLIFSGRGRRNN